MTSLGWRRGCKHRMELPVSAEGDTARAAPLVPHRAGVRCGAIQIARVTRAPARPLRPPADRLCRTVAKLIKSHRKAPQLASCLAASPPRTITQPRPALGPLPRLSQGQGHPSDQRQPQASRRAQQSSGRRAAGCRCRAVRASAARCDRGAAGTSAAAGSPLRHGGARARRDGDAGRGSRAHARRGRVVAAHGEAGAAGARRGERRRCARPMHAACSTRMHTCMLFLLSCCSPRLQTC